MKVIPPSSISEHMASRKKSLKKQKQIKNQKIKKNLLNKWWTELANNVQNLSHNLPEIDFTFADI